MKNKYDIINSGEFFKKFLQKKYDIEVQNPKFKEEFPSFISYFIHSISNLISIRDNYVEKFLDMGATDVQYIVETMLKFSSDPSILIEPNEKDRTHHDTSKIEI